MKLTRSGFGPAAILSAFACGALAQGPPGIGSRPNVETWTISKSQMLLNASSGNRTYISKLVSDGLPSQVVTAPISGGALDLGADLAGEPDPRATQWPGKVWGNAGYSDTAVQFYPPAGYRVHIISAIGTVSSFARGSVPKGTAAGLSWGLISNVVASTTDAALNPSCMAYVKQSVSSSHEAETTPFSFVGIGQNGFLGSDNVLVSRTAVYLNDTGLTIHIEQALVLTYEFVPLAAADSH